MSITIERQLASPELDALSIDRATMQRAADAALLEAGKHGAPFAGDRVVTVRVVDRAESGQLNAQWRDKHRPTNVLAFPADQTLPVDDGELMPAGDLVICASVVEAEAAAQGKLAAAHWAHMVIHGCLHLMGYDHIEEKSAQIMEALERSALEHLGIANPY